MNKSTLFVFTLLTALTASSVFAASEVPKSAANNISPIVKQLNTHHVFLNNAGKLTTQPPICSICQVCCQH